MDWSAQLFGLSEEFLNISGVGGGVLQTTASEAALTAVVAARTRYTKRHPDIPLDKMVLYVTTETHSLGTKAALILGLKCRALKVKAEKNYSLDADVLKEALKEDEAAGIHPFMLSECKRDTLNHWNSLREFSCHCGDHEYWNDRQYR